MPTAGLRNWRYGAPPGVARRNGRMRTLRYAVLSAMSVWRDRSVACSPSAPSDVALDESRVTRDVGQWTAADVKSIEASQAADETVTSVADEQSMPTIVLQKDEFGRDIEVVLDKHERDKEEKHARKRNHKRDKRRRDPSRSSSRRDRCYRTPLPPPDPFRPQVSGLIDDCCAGLSSEVEGRRLTHLMVVLDSWMNVETISTRGGSKVEAGAVRDVEAAMARHLTADRLDVEGRPEVVAEVGKENIIVEVDHLHHEPVDGAHRPRWSESGLIVLLTIAVPVRRERLIHVIDRNPRRGCREQVACMCLGNETNSKRCGM
uniref:Uncharacterized protein n=1 Tax=Peronospora matthiolae TaxID=2874970 RepID=A0AAV1TAW7_9STRA